MECEIVFIGEGWKWRVVSSAGVSRSSDKAYGLFYDCVLAAHAKGYTPAGVLPECYRKASSKAG
jgi:hypothetical protein